MKRVFYESEQKIIDTLTSIEDQLNSRSMEKVVFIELYKEFNNLIKETNNMYENNKYEKLPTLIDEKINTLNNNFNKNFQQLNPQEMQQINDIKSQVNQINPDKRIDLDKPIESRSPILELEHLNKELKKLNEDQEINLFLNKCRTKVKEYKILPKDSINKLSYPIEYPTSIIKIIENTKYAIDTHLDDRKRKDDIENQKERDQYLEWATSELNSLKEKIKNNKDIQNNEQIKNAADKDINLLDKYLTKISKTTKESDKLAEKIELDLKFGSKLNKITAKIYTTSENITKQNQYNPIFIANKKSNIDKIGNAIVSMEALSKILPDYKEDIQEYVNKLTATKKNIRIKLSTYKEGRNTKKRI